MVDAIPIDLTVAIHDPRWNQLSADPEAEICHIAHHCFAFLHNRLSELYEADHQSRQLGIAVVLTHAQEVQSLNAQFRGKDKPTNVLSFAADIDAMQPMDQELVIGDIILAYDVIAEEAAAQEKAMPDHMAHMVVHGMLHLLGYDHIVEEEALHMEQMERDILAKLGIKDPYLWRDMPHEFAATDPAPITPSAHGC